MNANLEAAQRIQEKYEFYHLALTFTILGFSIQKAKFQLLIASDILEIIGWLLLLISGLIGLLRIDWVPVLFNMQYRSDLFKRDRDYLLNCQASGSENVLVQGDNEARSVAEILERKVAAIEKLEPEINRIDTRTRKLYKWQKWLFFSGMLSLLLARAIIPVLNILEHFKCAAT